MREPIISDQDFIRRLSEEERKHAGFISTKEIFPLVCEHAALLESGIKPVGAIPTGFIKLDKALIGLKKADLIVVGAEPCVGKTAFVLSLAENMAHKGMKVGIFSLDTLREKIMQRLIAIRTSIPLWRIVTGRLNKGDMKRIEQCAESFKKLPLYIDDETDLDVLELRSRATELRDKDGLDFLIVDCFQFIRSFDNEPHNLNRVACGLKMIAVELNISIVITLNMERKQSDHHFPNFHDIRQWSLDRYADVVLMLRQSNQFEVDGSIRPIDIFVLKNKNGPTGMVELGFDYELASFIDAVESKK